MTQEYIYKTLKRVFITVFDRTEILHPPMLPSSEFIDSKVMLMLWSRSGFGLQAGGTWVVYWMLELPITVRRGSCVAITAFGGLLIIQTNFFTSCFEPQWKRVKGWNDTFLRETGLEGCLRTVWGLFQGECILSSCELCEMGLGENTLSNITRFINWSNSRDDQGASSSSRSQSGAWMRPKWVTYPGFNSLLFYQWGNKPSTDVHASICYIESLCNHAGVLITWNLSSYIQVWRNA